MRIKGTVNIYARIMVKRGLSQVNWDVCLFHPDDNIDLSIHLTNGMSDTILKAKVVEGNSTRSLFFSDLGDRCENISKTLRLLVTNVWIRHFWDCKWEKENLGEQ